MFTTEIIMAELNIITLGNAMHRISSFACPSQLPSITEFKAFSRGIYNTLVSSQHFDLRTASRSEEFLAYALVGSPAGDELAPMIWSSHGQAEIYGRLSGAENVFIHTVPYAIYFAAHNYKNVFVANCAATAIAANQLTSSDEPITNVTTLAWDSIYNSMPELDMAMILYSHIASDDTLFTSVLNSLKPNGVLVIQNASNGGALYEALADKKPLAVAAEMSLSADLHKKIMDRGDFIIQHFQGWVSHTVCVKVAA